MAINGTGYWIFGSGFRDKYQSDENPSFSFFVLFTINERLR
jgi:hypothetical protein